MIWHHPINNPPEPLTDVLVAVRGEERASEGFMLEGGEWWLATGHPVDVERVVAWAEMPLCPVLEVPSSGFRNSAADTKGGRPWAA